MSAFANSIVNNGSINATGFGFRGGTVINVNQAINTLFFDYVTNNLAVGAEKGESIVGFRTDLDALGGRYGRGAIANGGGGGMTHNSAGGGGSNGGVPANWFRGAGVMNDFGGTCGTPGAWAVDPAYIANGNALTNSSGGGQGGYSYSDGNQDACLLGPSYPANYISAGVPAANVLNTAWAGDWRQANGGDRKSVV